MKAKIIDILTTFSETDLMKFGEFIDSDYFNKNIISRKLYAELIKYAPAFESNSLTKQNLFSVIYPSKKYNEARLLNLLSGLYRLSEDFIAQESFMKKPLVKEHLLLYGINDRNLYKFFDKAYEKIQIEIDNKTLRDKEYYKKKQEIEYEHFANVSNTKRMYFLNKEPVQSYQDKFFEYFAVETLMNYSHLLNQKKYVVDHNFNMPFFEPLMDYIKENSLGNIPTVSIYYNLVLMIRENDEQYYFRIKELMNKHPNILEGVERLNVYTNLINFCIARWIHNTLKSEFHNETFDLYKKIITEGIYKFDKITLIGDTVFVNVVQSGLLVKEYNWVEEFINKYFNELAETDRLTTFNLCYALYYFKLKKYESALECLSKMDRKKIYFNIKINSLTLQIYYEMNHYENAFSVIDTYKHFLKDNKKITPHEKVRENNFANDVSNLLKIKSGTKNINKAEFNFHKDTRNTSYVRWLLEKSEELEKTKS